MGGGGDVGARVGGVYRVGRRERGWQEIVDEVLGGRGRGRSG